MGLPVWLWYFDSMPPSDAASWTLGGGDGGPMRWDNTLLVRWDDGTPTAWKD